MEPEATTPHAKKRRTQVSERREQEEMASLSPHNQEPPPATDAPRPVPTSHGQEPRHGAGAEGEDGADRISCLPDAILGEIISLLPTKDGARTRTLASRWRHLWLAAPLNLDVSRIPAANQDALAGVISRILAAHPGPARRFSVPALHLHRRRATVAAWLRSPALDNLQELEFDVGEIPNRRAPQLSLVTRPMQTLPASAFRFSSTLRVLTISKCHLLDNLVETLNFPQLRLLGLEGVQISDGSLHRIIASCPVLECLLLSRSFGFRCPRINSRSLRSIGMGTGELVIQDAPSLRRLIRLAPRRNSFHVSVVSAPKLETLGCLSDVGYTFNLALGTNVIERLHVISFKKEVCSVKILAVDIYQESLDAIMNLMRCFPCLEKVYIQMPTLTQSQYWGHKQHDLTRCLDFHLKTVVLKNYQGIKSEANFATFFILNAKMLEVMRFEGEACNDNKFVAKQHGLLQLEKRASRAARFHFTTSRCSHYLARVKHVYDLAKADPFECSC
ncbi:hypothetical protein ACP70R_028177 [Stipagrostis hirtigluma subsp. patula]